MGGFCSHWVARLTVKMFSEQSPDQGHLLAGRCEDNSHRNAYGQSETVVTLCECSLAVLAGFMVGPLVAALIPVSGFWPVTGTVEPPAWEIMMARRTLTASVARQAPKVQNPLPSVEQSASGWNEVGRCKAHTGCTLGPDH
jgi:hypothetical protein